MAIKEDETREVTLTALEAIGFETASAAARESERRWREADAALARALSEKLGVPPDRIGTVRMDRDRSVLIATIGAAPTSPPMAGGSAPAGPPG